MKSFEELAAELPSLLEQLSRVIHPPTKPQIDPDSGTLLPRRYKLDYPGSAYFVDWCHEYQKWVIVHGSTFTLFLTSSSGWDYPGHDTCFFDSPEAALEAWQLYMKAIQACR